MNESRRSFLGFLGLALVPLKIKALGRLFGTPEPNPENPKITYRIEHGLHEFEVITQLNSRGDALNVHLKLDDKPISGAEWLPRREPTNRQEAIFHWPDQSQIKLGFYDRDPKTLLVYSYRIGRGPQFDNEAALDLI